MGLRQIRRKEKAVLSSAWFPIGFVIAILMVQALALHLMGRFAICSCGYVKLWEGNPFGPGNYNSLSDTLTAAAGFLFAAWAAPILTILVGIGIEAGLALAIRDNLALNIVMLVHEVPWIKAWQAAGQAH